MDKNRLVSGIKKLFAIVIIFLFFGVSAAPSINTAIVKAPTDNNLVEVTSQAYGIQGFSNTTVKLTKQQYQDLQQYLAGFNARLNQTATEDEAVPLFKEIVVELNEYHLLPRGMTVTQVQTLVTGSYLDSPIKQRLTETIEKKPLNSLNNTLCLVAGLTDNTQIFSLLLWSWLFVANHVDFFYQFFRCPYLFLIMLCSLVGIMAFDYIRPVMLWSVIYLLGGNGSLLTLGLQGMKQHKGYLRGEIIGFSGLKILLDWRTPTKYFFVGSAWKVQLSQP